MSDPYLSTRSTTCNHHKKFKVFSSPRRPETHFRHAQGHQRLGELTVSTNIFQSTINRVYEVVHQKTFTTEIGKHSVWFSEVIKEFHHYFHEKEAGRHKKVESKVALLS